MSVVKTQEGWAVMDGGKVVFTGPRKACVSYAANPPEDEEPKHKVGKEKAK